ncbi:uncharacterized protein G2W53_005061 [Senna tora]|uniref:Uncharacterized protein n=1 Tax=Senna tora TaxID=362788 RepID=A0A834XDV7_9FABA|nr:uncharacterized protein G2W53_005061 [Senna tora]
MELVAMRDIKRVSGSPADLVMEMDELAEYKRSASEAEASFFHFFGIT